MFQITRVTTTSLSFSWQEPTNANGQLAGYELSCQPLLSGISSLSQTNLGPAERATTVTDLLPGVGYNCSIAARNNAGASNLVYADSTTIEIGMLL